MTHVTSQTARRVALAIALLLLYAAFNFLPTFAQQDATTRAQWRADLPHTDVARPYALVDALLDRGLTPLATEELAPLENALRQSPAPNSDEVLVFARVAARCAMHNANLATSDQRDACAQRLGELLSLVAKDQNPQTLATLAATSAYARLLALQLTRDYYTLGALEYEAQQSRADVADAWLDAAFNLSKALAQTLAQDDARIFLYWSARAALAKRSDAQRCDVAERLAKALANASKERADQFYFFALLLMVDVALENGDLTLVSKRIDATLKALEQAQTQNPPREIAVALVAQEANLLQLEGKLADASRQVVSDVDLLDAQLPPQERRFANLFYDPFEALYFMRAKILWRRALEDDSLDEAQRDAMRQDARSALDNLHSQLWKARAAMLALDVAASAEDWKSLQTVAEQAYRNGELWLALQSYDRAWNLAQTQNAEDDAYRLRSLAAGLADKICRDNYLQNAKIADAPDASEFREQTAERLEQLAKLFPQKENAPNFYRLALLYLEEDGALDYQRRIEFLKLFPNAPQRPELAIELARYACEQSAYDYAQEALDLLGDPNYKPQNQTQLELAIFKSRTASLPSHAQRQAFALLTAVRLLDKSVLPDDHNANVQALTAAIQDALQRLLQENATAQPQTQFYALQAVATLALDGDLPRTLFNSILDALLALYDQPDTSLQTRTTLVSYALAIALELDEPDTLDALLQRFHNQSGALDLQTLAALIDFAENAPEKTRRNIGEFVNDALNDLPDSTRLQLARADALRLLGQDQDALNLYAKLRNDAQEDVSLRAVRGLARLLAARSGQKEAQMALKFWEQIVAKEIVDSPQWWDAQEECIKLEIRLGQSADASKRARALWLTHQDPSDPERKERWNRIINAPK
ncbi:MAG: hypothetical protein Q4G03_08185 [Planctomycetia bacterium]|nr:hypothetical protein [Planctomycetia bacterium]